MNLQRRTATGRYIPEADGIRFLAISMVVLVHLQAMMNVARGDHIAPPFGPMTTFLHNPPGNNWWNVILPQGQFGVHLFFILSGFILGLPFLEGYVSKRRFYMRRLTRLEPPYLIALALCAGAGIWFGATWKELGQSIPYLSVAFAGRSALDAPLWSLAVEVQFYLILPLLAWAFYRRRGRLLLLGAILLTEFAQNSFVLGSPRLTLSLPGSLQFFLVGMLLADLYVRSRHHSAWWDVAGVVSLSLLIFWPLITGNLYSFFQFFLLPILGAGIIGGALFGVRLRRAFSAKWVCVIGGMAYSIYLTHFPLMYLLSRSGFWRQGSYNLHVVLLGLYLIPIVFAFGLLFYVVVEKPCMDPDWPQHLRNRLRDISVRSYGRERTPRPPRGKDVPAPAAGTAG